MAGRLTRCEAGGAGDGRGQSDGRGEWPPIEFPRTFGGVDCSSVIGRTDECWPLILKPMVQAMSPRHILSLQGRPFNVTDFAFGPDGEMYLTTGGRGSQSGLYRVRWVGSGSSVAETSKEVAPAILRRRAMEESHRDASALDQEELFDGLGDADPAIRYAARVGVERRSAGGAGW